MKRIKVAALFGGRSTEYEVSCRSFLSVANNINREKFEVIPVGMDLSGRFFVYRGEFENIRNLSWTGDSDNLFACAFMPRRDGEKRATLALSENERIEIDVVLPIVHGANGEDGALQGLCELYGIACAGAGISGSVLGYDKEYTKIIAASAGIKQGKYIAVREYEYRKKSGEFIDSAAEKLGFPCFVKPARAGSSVGIKKAADRAGLSEAIDFAFKYDSKIVIEENISGREIEVSVVGNENRLFAAPPGEICPNADFYDYETKYINDTAESFIPARIDAKTAAKVTETAKRIYTLLEIGGFSRVDFFVTGEGEVIFNEINTIPGFTEISMFARMMANAGVGFSELLEKIIMLALEEQKSRESKKRSVGG